MSEKIEIIEELGQGGFATTYKARVIDKGLLEETKGCEIVAMKVPHRFNESTLKQEIIKNASMHMRLQRVSSPNLVKYLTFDTYLSKTVMLMEFVPGNLRRLIGPITFENDKPGPSIPIEKALQIIRGILDGLVVIHQEAFVHRDIKPENILMDGDVPKICDLGISAFLKSKSVKAHTTAGSWHYMPPEVMEGTGASFTADIWSTGVLLYEMLTGVLPFGIGYDTFPKAIIDRVCKEDPLPPSHYADIPAYLDRIVLKALEKNPEKRIESAAAFLALLNQPQDMPAPVDKKEKNILQELQVLLDEGAALATIQERWGDLKSKYPDAPQLDAFMGEVYVRYHHFHQAIAVLEKAVAGNARTAESYWHLAIAYERTKELDKACWALEQALQMGLAPGLKKKASNWLRILKMNAGVEKKKDVKSTSEKSTSEALQRALKDIRIAMEKDASLDDIVSELTALKKEYPEACELDVVLGEVYLRFQHYSDAITALEAAVEKNDENALCFWNLAIAYERTGKLKKAFRALNRAMRIGLEPALQRHAASWRRVLQSKGNSTSGSGTFSSGKG